MTFRSSGRAALIADVLAVLPWNAAHAQPFDYDKYLSKFPGMATKPKQRARFSPGPDRSWAVFQILIVFVPAGQ